MLDRLEAAFVGQRQFLDDAGHELKTPLTVLRGHLELLDNGSPEEVAATRELLLDEIDRMSRLVGDLILLAKSDRPDFLRARPVDLTGLTTDLVAKARGLGARDWVLDGTGERQGARRRAAAHPGGAPARRQRGQAHRATATRSGSGRRTTTGSPGSGFATPDPAYPRKIASRIFERFGRSAVPHGDEGFGLGLSIVGAIVQAHGGTVQVEDADPSGARFVLTLPVAAEMEEEWPGS